MCSTRLPLLNLKKLVLSISDIVLREPRDRKSKAVLAPLLTAPNRPNWKLLFLLSGFRSTRLGFRETADFSWAGFVSAFSSSERWSLSVNCLRMHCSLFNLAGEDGFIRHRLFRWTLSNSEQSICGLAPHSMQILFQTLKMWKPGITQEEQKTHGILSPALGYLECEGVGRKKTSHFWGPLWFIIKFYNVQLYSNMNIIIAVSYLIRLWFHYKSILENVNQLMGRSRWISVMNEITNT